MKAIFSCSSRTVSLLGGILLTCTCLAADPSPGTSRVLPPTQFFTPAPTHEDAAARIEAQRRLLEAAGPAGMPSDRRPGAVASPSTDPVFNLDFPGGTPRALVAAIEKATGEPLNVVIPVEDAEVSIPPVKVQKVTVEDLFSALAVASRRTVAQVTGTYFSDLGGRGRRSQYAMTTTSYAFEKKGNVWVFHAEKPVTPPNDDEPAGRMLARFFQLEPYLTNYTVDDIITAVQTAWDMTNRDHPTPTLKFHKETKLLIAAGDESQLRTIEDALTALRPDLGNARLRKPTSSTNSTPAGAASDSKKL